MQIMLLNINEVVENFNISSYQRKEIHRVMLIRVNVQHIKIIKTYYGKILYEQYITNSRPEHASLQGKKQLCKICSHLLVKI